jgi:hypothetical protein
MYRWAKIICSDNEVVTRLEYILPGILNLVTNFVLIDSRFFGI